MLDPLQIGDIEVKPGEKVFEYLKVYEANGITTSLPVGIVYGKNPGPTICLTGCTQGSTYTGPEAATRIWNQVDPKKLNGVIITVPVVNVPLFYARVPRRSPVDNKIIERECFPGKPEGTLSEVIAYRLLNDIILKSDYHVDFRGGDLDEDETHFILYHITGNKEMDKKLDDIARISNMEYLFKVPLTEARKSNLGGAAVDKGVVSVVCMCARGLGMIIEEEIQKNIEFATNIMKYLKMIEGEVKPYPGKQYVFDKPGRMTAKYGGIWYPKIKWGEKVKRNQVTGYIKNLKGEILQEFVNPDDGVLHIIKPARVVHIGETVYAFQTLKEAWK